jgi:hypothetical protein
MAESGPTTDFAPLASQTAATSIQNDSGLPQGPAAPSTGRLELRQTDCATAVAGWYDRRAAGIIGGGRAWERGREEAHA